MTSNEGNTRTFTFLGNPCVTSQCTQLLNALCKKKTGSHTFHFANLNKKDDVRVTKLNEGDLSLFDATNSTRSKRPFEVKANGTAYITHIA